MIETLTYISEPYDQINVHYVDYSIVAHNYPDINQGSLYKEINQFKLYIPYVISKNRFIFCSNGGDSSILTSFSSALQKICPSHLINSNLKVENMNLSMEENEYIFRRIIRESILRKTRGGRREKSDISIPISGNNQTSDIERYLKIVISGQLISNSVLLITDIKHRNTGGLSLQQFRNLSTLNSYERYKIIREQIEKIFKDVDDITIGIPGNKDLVLKRLKITT